MRRIVFILLFALVFTIPWENLIAFASFGTLSRAIGLGAAALGVVAVVGTGQARRLNAIHYLMGLFVLWAFLSLAWTADPQMTRMRIITFCQLAGMAWLIWEFAATPFRQLLLMHAYVLGGCVALLTQWISASHVDLASRIGIARIGGGGLNANDYALVILTSIPLAAFYASNKESKNKLLRLAAWCYCPVAGFGVLMTGSRMGFVILLFAVLLIVFWHLRRRPVYALVLIAMVAIFAVQVPGWMPTSTFERLASTTEALRSGEGGWSLRLQIWTAGLKTFPRHPIIGTGSGSFPTVTSPELEATIAQEHKAHNVYLRVLVELGVIGMTLFGLMLLTAVAYALRMPNRERFLWITILATWGLGAFALSIEDRKLLWFLLGLLTSQYATLRRQEVLAHARKMMALRRPRRLLAVSRG